MKSHYLDNLYLNAALRRMPFTPPETLYVALYTELPTPSSPGVEVSGGGYERQLVTFAEPINGQAKSENDVVYPIAIEPWGDVVGFALVDALAGGHVFYFAGLGYPRTVDVSDQVKFPAGALVCQER